MAGQPLATETLPKRQQLHECVRVGMLDEAVAGEFLKASFLAETLWTWNKNNLDRLVMVALLLKEAGQFTTAQEWLKKMQDQAFQQNHSEFFYLRAQCHAGLNDFAEARNSLKHASGANEDLKVRALNDPLFASIYSADPEKRIERTGRITKRIVVIRGAKLKDQ